MGHSPCETTEVGETMVVGPVDDAGGGDDSTDADDCWITDVCMGGLGDAGYMELGDGPELLNFGRFVILLISVKRNNKQNQCRRTQI